MSLVRHLPRTCHLALRVWSARHAGAIPTKWPTHARTSSLRLVDGVRPLGVAALSTSSSEPQPAVSPPPSSSPTAPTQSHSASEVVRVGSLASVLDHPVLVVTREIEYGNLIFGYEQANKYAIRLADGRIVGFIAEESSLARALLRQALRTHRAFHATVFDSSGAPVLRVRRPAYLFSSSIYVHTMEGDQPGDQLGEVHMNWHPWRRRYDLFDAQGRQFGEVDAPLLAVSFPVRGDSPSTEATPPVVASVDKDWTGLGRELFTDARQYVVRYDPSATPEAVLEEAREKMGALEAPSRDDASKRQLETPAEVAQRSETPAQWYQERVASDADAQVRLQSGALDLAKRATVLATAISIDYDYFSLHSSGPGLFHMPFIFPIPGFGGRSGAEDAPSNEGASVGENTPTNEGASVGEGTGSNVPPWMGGADRQGTGESSAPPKGDENPWATFEPGTPDEFDSPSEDADRMGYSEGDWGSGDDADSGGGLFRSLWGAFTGDDDDSD